MLNWLLDILFTKNRYPISEDSYGYFFFSSSIKSLILYLVIECFFYPETDINFSFILLGLLFAAFGGGILFIIEAFIILFWNEYLTNKTYNSEDNYYLKRCLELVDENKKLTDELEKYKSKERNF